MFGYANTYRMMHEVEKKEEARFSKEGVQPREVHMVIKQSAKLCKKYDPVTCNEVVVVFVGENGDPPV